MGQTITGIAAQDPAIEIAAGIDVRDGGTNPYPVFSRFEECDVPADVIVDFSSPAVFDSMMDYSVARQIPVVVCTTGLSEAQLKGWMRTAKRWRCCAPPICLWVSICC